VGMLDQLADRLGFTNEPLENFLVSELVQMRDFQSDMTFQLYIPAEQHKSLAAFTDLFEHFVLVNLNGFIVRARQDLRKLIDMPGVFSEVARDRRSHPIVHGSVSGSIPNGLRNWSY